MANGVLVELSYDEVDRIVLNELKVYLEGILHDPWPCHHDYAETLETVDSYFTVISDQMTREEYLKYKESLSEPYLSLVEKVYPKDDLI
jgi:hypothetical protein